MDAQEVAAAEPEPADTLSAAFRAGDLDLKVHIAADGYSLVPTSFVLAFVGWQEFGASSDFGVSHVSDFTVGFGMEGYFCKPWVAEALFDGIVTADTPPTRTDVDVWNAGILGRGTIHLRRAGIEEDLPSSIDPYVVGIAGPTFGSFAAHFDVADGRIGGGSAEVGARLGVGGGANFVSHGLVASLELRYLAGFNFDEQKVVFVHDAAGNDYQYDRARFENPPRGFAWVIGLGKRF
jgi:hypothetical protein